MVEGVSQEVQHPGAGRAIVVVAQLEAVGVVGLAVQLDDYLDVDLVVGGPQPVPTSWTRKKVSFPDDSSSAIESLFYGRSATRMMRPLRSPVLT